MNFGGQIAIYILELRNAFTPVRIFPMIPFLSSAETIVWNNIQTKGVVNKKIKQLDLVTNYRAYQYDYGDHMGNYVLISAIEDVIVSNQRRLSDSNRYGNYVRSSYTITGHANTKTTSQTVGDVSILANGRPYILFKGISDPNGLARMIKSMKKQCKFTIEPPADLNKDYIIDTLESESHVENNIVDVENSICIYCGKKNLPNSKFCNHCGQSLPISNKCRICNHLNTIDAIFCNQCGHNLKSNK
jgi:ribosomal protein L40E